MEKYGGAGQATDDNNILCMRFACWVRMTTDTHSEYVIYINFPLRHWLSERASILRYMYTAFLVDCKWHIITNILLSLVPPR